MQDYYKILRVHPSVSEEEIKEAYRRLAHKYHPDAGGDAEQFKAILNAYNVLSDPYKRGAYDATLAHNQNIVQQPRPSPTPQPQVVYVKKAGAYWRADSTYHHWNNYHTNRIGWVSSVALSWGGFRPVIW